MAKGVPILGKDPLGKAKYANVTESGDLRVQLSGASGNIVSPATEDKLEQVRQLLSGVATEAKLEQARTLLDAISTKDFATSSNQDALKTVVDDLKSELLLVKSELATIKANQLSGEQKVQLSGTFTEDILSKMDLSNSLLALISHGQTKAVLNSWQQVQHIVRAGLHHQVFQIGDQFVTEFNGAPSVWVVIGIDHDKPTDPSFTHSLTIRSQDCLLAAQFDRSEPDNPDSDRQTSGNNRYLHSVIRQWLNSAETIFTWQPQHQYDRAPEGAPYDGPGFLKLLDPDLVAVLGAVDKQVARNTVTDGGGQDLFSDKVFLLSRVEVYGGKAGVTTGETPYPYYEAMASGSTSSALDGRIKFLDSSPHNWWLRCPHVESAHRMGSVGTNGQIGLNTAITIQGVAPAVVIV